MKRLLAALLAGLAALSCAPALAAAPRASLTDIENDVMCPSCRESLSVAESPQAMAERAYIQGLIDQGLDKKQIEQNLVTQYGPAVLAKPPAHGFNLTVYVLPAVLVAGGLALLAVVLPRWRRAARVRRAEPMSDGPALAPPDRERLDAELARFDG